MLKNFRNVWEQTSTQLAHIDINMSIRVDSKQSRLGKHNDRIRGRVLLMWKDIDHSGQLDCFPPVAELSRNTRDRPVRRFGVVNFSKDFVRRFPLTGSSKKVHEPYFVIQTWEKFKPVSGLLFFPACARGTLEFIGNLTNRSIKVDTCLQQPRADYLTDSVGRLWPNSSSACW